PLTYEFDFGSGFTPASGSSVSHVFPDNLPNNAPYTVRVRVTDVDGAQSIGTTSVVVNNAPPQPTIGSVSPVLLLGTPITPTGSAIDPGPDAPFTLGWAVYKDGATTPLATQAGSSFTFTPPNNGLYQIVLTATDKDGGVGVATQTLTIGKAASS